MAQRSIKVKSILGLSCTFSLRHWRPFSCSIWLRFWPHFLWFKVVPFFDGTSSILWSTEGTFLHFTFLVQWVSPFSEPLLQVIGSHFHTWAFWSSSLQKFQPGWETTGTLLYWDWMPSDDPPEAYFSGWVTFTPGSCFRKKVFSRTYLEFWVHFLV